MSQKKILRVLPEEKKHKYNQRLKSQTKAFKVTFIKGLSDSKIPNWVPELQTRVQQNIL